MAYSRLYAKPPVTTFTNLQVQSSPVTGNALANEGYPFMVLSSYTNEQMQSLPTDKNGIILNSESGLLEYLYEGIWNTLTTAGQTDIVLTRKDADPAAQTGLLYLNTTTHVARFCNDQNIYSTLYTVANVDGLLNLKTAAVDPAAQTGLLYLNTTTHLARFCNDQNIYSTLYTVTDPNGIFSLKAVASANDRPAGTAGMMLYQTDQKAVQLYDTTAWYSLYKLGNDVNVLDANIASTAAQRPAEEDTLPSMILFQSDINQFIGTNVNGGNITWNSFYTNPLAAAQTGNTLTAPYVPFFFPQGVTANVEVAANNLPTYTYYNASNIRCHIGTWGNLYFMPMAATVGTGLANNTKPFIIPHGARADVEVAANEFFGFLYWDTTNNVLRLRTNAAWVTITMA